MSDQLQHLGFLLQELRQPQPSKAGFDGDDPSWAVAATHPWRVARRESNNTSSSPRANEAQHLEPGSFIPRPPDSIAAAGLRESQVESLVLKYLLNSAAASGRDIAEQLALPFGIVGTLLGQMKSQLLLAVRSEAPLGDYQYELTPSGTERARRYARQSTYFGAAPVSLAHYVSSVHAQSVRAQTLTVDRVAQAFADLILNPPLLNRLGEALNLGLGLFLHGAPGNGKSAIAERIVRAYRPTVWIPRAVNVGGEILRLFDPIRHLELPYDEQDAEPVDRRWVRIRRPTLCAGGDLQLSDFDVVTNPLTHISEAPLHLKSNCGVLIIDDFGRNRFRPDELLNRLIIPLERRLDTLRLPTGRSFPVPFEVFIVFATNLDPQSLVDEAFLRRIPFKIGVSDPTEEQYRQLFLHEAQQQELQCGEEVVDHLLEVHYRQLGRVRRFCHPRDLVRQVKNAVQFRRLPGQVTPDLVNAAVEAQLSVAASR